MQNSKQKIHCVICAAILTVCFTGCGKKPGAEVESKPAAASSLGSGSATVPVDVANPTNPTQNDWLNLGWQTFIAVNWPAVAPTSSTNLGQPDTSLSIGATASNGAPIPTVWLTYRDLSTLMLAKGANPGAWNGGMPAPPTGCASIPANSVAPGFQPMVLDMVSKFSKFPSEVDQATNNPLIDQAGWYVTFDVRMNQSEYTYIQQNGYYDAANQIKAFQPPSTGIPPLPRNGQESYFNPALPSYAQFGALEVKAAWRVLDPAKDVLSRYFTQEGYFLQPDGTTCEGPVTFGLIGLHILRLTPTTPSTWFWSTFEQVDNVTAPSGIKRPDGSALTPTLAQAGTPNGNCGSQYNVGPPSVTGNIPWNNQNTPVNVCQVTYPLPSAVQTANTAWQAKLQGTPFQYYQLDDTINPTVSGGTGSVFPPINNPSNTVGTSTLANTSMETYFQEPGQSCLSCHGYGAPQGAPSPLTGTNQIFTFLLSNADSSSTTALLRRRPPLKLPLDRFPHRRIMQRK